MDGSAPRSRRRRTQVGGLIVRGIAFDSLSFHCDVPVTDWTIVEGNVQSDWSRSGESEV